MGFKVSYFGHYKKCPFYFIDIEYIKYYYFYMGANNMKKTVKQEPKKRAVRYKGFVSISMNKELLDFVDDEAKKNSIGRSAMVSICISEYKATHTSLDKITELMNNKDFVALLKGAAESEREKG